MKSSIRKILGATACVLAMAVQGNASVRSKAIVVEFPSDLPAAAQARSEAMYLYHTEHSQAILYLEQDQGRKLAILDVSDPAKIRAVGEVAIPATGAYDFVQTLNSGALIHYRDHSGFAVINFKHYKQPILEKEPAYLHAAVAEKDGASTLLLVTSSSSSAPEREREVEIVNIASPSDTAPLATVRNVIQRVDRQQTGTIFLLSDQGLTVVRRLAAEQEHAAEVDQKSEN
jgi:hypothetical protein